MTTDDFDGWLRHQIPRVEVSDEQVDRLASAVIARAISIPQPNPHPWWRGLMLATSLSPPRLAMLMAAAAMLGIVLGNTIQISQPTSSLATLLFSSTLFPAGS